MVNITEDMCRNGSADRVALHTFGYVFIGTSFVAMLVLVSLDMYLAGLIVASVLCGMAESRGRCGMSHIGMIAPMKSLDLNSWFKCSLAYTLCGTISAYLVGLLIVGLGSWIDLGKSVLYIGFSCLICVLFLLRESSLIRFNPPQCDHQTYKEWTAMFGLTTGVGMWGAHIGLALTTVITYSGLYCLLVVAFGLGFGFGEWLLVAFWLGRTVLLWVIPWLLKSSHDGLAIGINLERSTGMFRVCSFVGISSVLVVYLAKLFALVA